MRGRIGIGIVPRITQQGVFDPSGKPHWQIETPDARCQEETPRKKDLGMSSRSIKLIGKPDEWELYATRYRTQLSRTPEQHAQLHTDNRARMRSKGLNTGNTKRHNVSTSASKLGGQRQDRTTLARLTTIHALDAKATKTSKADGHQESETIERDWSSTILNFEGHLRRKASTSGSSIAWRLKGTFRCCLTS